MYTVSDNATPTVDRIYNFTSYFSVIWIFIKSYEIRIAKNKRLIKDTYYTYH